MNYLTPEVWLGLAVYVERKQKIEYLLKSGEKVNPERISDAELNRAYITKCVNVLNEELKNAWPNVAKHYFYSANVGRKNNPYSNSRVQINPLTFADCIKLFPSNYNCAKDILKTVPIGKFLFIEICMNKFNNRWDRDSRDKLRDIKDTIVQLKNPENKKYFGKIVAMISKNKKIGEQHCQWIKYNTKFVPYRYKSIELCETLNNPLAFDIWQTLENKTNDMNDCDTKALNHIKTNIESLLPFIARDDDLRRNYNEWSENPKAAFEMLKIKVMNLPDGDEKQENIKFLENVEQNRYYVDMNFDLFSEVVEVLQDIKSRSKKIEDGFDRLATILNLNSDEKRGFVELREQAVRDEVVANCWEQHERLQQQENKQEKQLIWKDNSSPFAQYTRVRPALLENASQWEEEMDNENNEAEFTQTFQKTQNNWNNTTRAAGNSDDAFELTQEVMDAHKEFGIPLHEFMQLVGVAAQEKSESSINVLDPSNEMQNDEIRHPIKLMDFPRLGLKTEKFSAVSQRPNINFNQK